MNLINFTGTEIACWKRFAAFIRPEEAAVNRLGARTTVVKTSQFEEECRRLAAYYPAIGLEHGNARVFFDASREGRHRILLNADVVSGLSWLHALVHELVLLHNLDRFNQDVGNIYRLTQESALSHYYYEFLLWSKYQAMNIATRVHALAAWHASNGEAPPPDGCYQFTRVNFQSGEVQSGLNTLQTAATLADWREQLWEVVAALAMYFGQTAFFQPGANPSEADPGFPAGLMTQQLGSHGLAFYALLQRCSDYDQWQEQQAGIRQVVLAMQAHGQGFFEPQEE